MTPIVLIASSLRWPNAARLSIACKSAGFSVAAIATRDHPIHRMRSPDRTFIYSPLDPRASLRTAIERCRPQLIFPCDDRVVGQLHALHAEFLQEGDPTAKLIETSLGRPDSFEMVRKKSLLGGFALLPHVRVPQTDAISSLSALKAWVAIHGLPAILKLDGRTGGQDVFLLSDRGGIERVYVSSKLRQCGLRALWNVIRRQDLETLLSEWREGYPAMSVQALAAGRPANCAVACWRGQVLDFIAVEAVRTRSRFGAATVVRRVEGVAMRAAAESIVRHLGLSGMCGFDFMIDDCSDAATLIEINPRATQINHFPLGPQGDLPTALLRALRGDQPCSRPSAALPEAAVALFPQAWPLGSQSPDLADAFHDVPYEEPELLRYYGYQASGGGAQGALSRLPPAYASLSAFSPEE